MCACLCVCNSKAFQSSHRHFNSKQNIYSVAVICGSQMKGAVDDESVLKGEMARVVSEIKGEGLFQ